MEITNAEGGYTPEIRSTESEFTAGTLETDKPTLDGLNMREDLERPSDVFRGYFCSRESRFVEYSKSRHMVTTAISR